MHKLRWGLIASSCTDDNASDIITTRAHLSANGHTTPPTLPAAATAPGAASHACILSLPPPARWVTYPIYQREGRLHAVRSLSGQCRSDLAQELCRVEL